MRYHRIYRLIDPRYPLEHPRHIRYVGHTSKKLSDQLDKHLSEWSSAGGPRPKWLRDMSRAGAIPDITAIEKVESARAAKERWLYWIDYYKGQGYELINVQLSDRFPAWDRQRVIEDFQVEVMRLLLGQESPYRLAMQRLEEKGEGDSTLYSYLRDAEIPDLSLEEIPSLFRERDERVRGLERKVMRAIGSGGIQEPLASALVEAIEEGRRSLLEEGSAIDRYMEMVAVSGEGTGS